MPLVVAGAHRSGTTLMTRLLDGHPEILTLAGETKFFTQFRERKHLKGADLFPWITGRLMSPSKGKLPVGETTEDAIHEPNQFWQEVSEALGSEKAKALLLKGMSNSDHTELWHSMIEVTTLADRRKGLGYKFVLEKTPDNEHALQQMEQITGHKPTVIHMIRDPFENIASRMRETKQSRFDQIVTNAIRWRRSAIHGTKFQTANNSHHRFIRLPELQTSSKEMMESVANFLRLPAAEILSSPTEHNGSQEWRGNSFRKKTPQGGVDASFVKLYAETILSNEEMTLVGEFVGDIYETFGFTDYSTHCKKSSIKRMKRLLAAKSLGPKEILANSLILRSETNLQSPTFLTANDK